MASRTHALDLSGPWAKVERSKVHIDDLRRRIAEAYPNGELFTYRQQYEAEKGAIVVYIESTPKIPQEWSLIVGDAVHNLRGALDHLAWQLACRKLRGKEPVDRNVIRFIHFPVCMTEGEWGAYTRRKLIRRVDLAKLKKLQPFKMPAKVTARSGPHLLDFFAGFNGINNVDKHRKIELISTLTHTAGWTDNWKYVQCTPVADKTGHPGAGHIKFTLGDENLTPKVGDEVYRVTVIAEGPDPQMDFKPSLSSYVAIREGFDVMRSLDMFAQKVSDIIGAFAETPRLTIWHRI